MVADTHRCEGCYQSFSGWWCDNCDQWPCICHTQDCMERGTIPLPCNCGVDDGR